MALPLPTIWAKALGPAVAGDHAQAHLGQPHAGVGGGHTHVRRHGQFKSAAEGKPVDGGHHRLAALLHTVEQVSLSAAGQIFALRLVEICEFLDVRPGHEGLLSGAREDDDPDVCVVLSGFDGRGQGVDDLTVEGVERFRPGDGQGENPVFQGFQDG